MTRSLYCFIICVYGSKIVLGSTQNTQNEFKQTRVVITTLGEVEGTVHYAIDNSKPVYAFYSIPYAEPPIGSNRFQPPIPAKPWTGIRDATKIRHFCIQDYEVANAGCSLLKPLPLNQPDDTKFYSEDCLELDVYTPDINAKLPVMFWIHGGGFNVASGHLYNGTSLSAFRNVVIVSINYRLAHLGFLSTGDKHMPGNMGLKDQVEALKWVKQNIYAFGGEPNTVTIFGDSAGSWSTSAHLVSPMSKGLFKYAILQSGSILTDIVVNEKPEDTFDEAAGFLGCANGTKSDITNCVKQSSVEDIHKLVIKTAGFTKNDWVTVDGEFFPKHPKYLYEEADFSDTVVMIGTTEHEMYMYLAFWSHDGNYNYDTFLEEIKYPTEVFYQKDTVTVENLNKIAKFYFETDTTATDEKTYRDKALEITTDFTMEFPVLNLTNTIVERGGKAFLYIFSHSPSYMRLSRSREAAAHLDELFLLFGYGFINPNKYNERITYSEEEETFAHILMKYWTNFAKTGDPNSADLPLWPQFNLESEEYAVLQPQPYVRQLFRKEKFQFWKTFMQDIENKRHVIKVKRDEL
ncbi:unnamed protein product [Owenia fusiformis]|uniref:Carboxylic ester hydrolase n=1 Tax=Owenia fusiformis TaxID=6347 RepID=A0A8J1T6X2_OWEFU|nr:unnamed protein product [Owenia fusiformis]